MKFNKWVNPKNGQTRIYVNGSFGYGIKVYVVDGGDTGHFPPGFPEIVVRAQHLIGQSQLDSIIDEIGEEVEKSIGGRDRESFTSPKFSDYLNLAK